MVYLVLKRQSFDYLIEEFGKVPSPIWINKGVLSEVEIESVRASGVNLTNFGRDVSHSDGIASAIDVVQQHHPGEVVWTDYDPE